MNKSLSQKDYDLFLRYGDPMCLILSRDFLKTEKLREKIVMNDNTLSQ